MNPSPDLTSCGASDPNTPPETPSLPFPVVGVGASAGGLAALTDLLKALPPNTGMSFVVIQHLDPTHDSALSQILGRATAMPVAEATDGRKIEANHVYIISPNTALALRQGTLCVRPRGETSGGARSIDDFFESLASDQHYRSIGVILSGTATDGTQGLEAIKAEGGITFAQDDSAAYDSMPRNAVAAGCVDLVLSPVEIARELGEIAKQPSMSHYIARADHPVPEGGSDDQAQAETGAGFHRIIQALRRHRGVDFAFYKSSTVQRRITRRMVLHKVRTPEEYADLLQHDAAELEALHADLLISVTSFFRNPEAFDALKRLVLAPFAKRSGQQPLRVWVAGCSTGQEAYSLAMAFLEVSEQQGDGHGLQIFATDLSENALKKARSGLYPKSIAETLSSERLRRFFVEEPGGYRVQKSLREMCIFARQDVTRDPPFSRLDLVSCRNMLIYFDGVLQRRALPLFHYALKNGGFLFLGASESVGPFTELFEPMDKQHRIFAKKPVPTPTSRTPFAPVSPGSHPTPPADRSALAKAQPELNAQREADRVTLNRCAPPGVLIDDALQVLQFRGDTSAFLKPPIGTATLHLLKMTQEGLHQPLSTAITRAREENSFVRVENVPLGPSGGNRVAHIEVIPLKNLKERTFLVLFEEAKRSPGLGAGGLVSTAPPPAISADATHAQWAARIAELERELGEARDAAQAHQEDYEAANEELQASNEEVQSANEELQSINEELETSKEELESTNEELTTVNEEMAGRNVELARLNDDLNNLFVSINTAIVLLSGDLTIRSFSPLAGRAFNLVSADVGRPFHRIRHQLHGPEIEQMIIDVIDSVTMRECDVQDKDGRWYCLRIRPYMTLDKRIDGAVLVMADIDKQLEAVRFSELRYRRLFEAAEDGVVIIDPESRKIVAANPCLGRWLDRSPESLLDKTLWEIGLAADADAVERMIGRLHASRSFYDDDLTMETGDGRRLFLEMVANLYQERGRDVIQCNLRDVTMRKAAENALRESEERFRTLADAAPVLIWRSGLDKTLTHFNKAWLDFTGRTIEEEINGGWFVDVHPDDADRCRQISDAAFDAREAFEMEFRLRHHRGEYRWLLKRGVPFFEADGTFKGYVGACVDIHDQKQSVDLIRAARDAAEEAGRVKDQFLASLSHELRTPLTPVLMFAATMANAPAIPEDLRSGFVMIRRNVTLLSRIIDDLLDLTRIAKGTLEMRMEPIQPHDVLRQSLEVVETEQREKSLAITCQFVKPQPTLKADAGRLQQVFTNLLKNAVKFTPAGGKISVRTEATEEYFHVTITDTGLGILPEEITRIFEPFAQGWEGASPRYGGLGLGLSICAVIVRAHGGRIWAQSRGRDQGATFHVELPLAST